MPGYHIGEEHVQPDRELASETAIAIAFDSYICVEKVSGTFLHT